MTLRAAKLIYRRIISGQAGWWAAPLRGALRILSLPYRVAIHLRNRGYDKPGAATRVSVPVISVGNLTVGGTGKTPLVIDIAARLIARGLSPAVVARGYHAEDGQPNDEELLIRRRCPATSYVADPDRIAAAQEAITKCQADVIILDDGFQHRRIARDLDIVLIDATCPFGFDHLLPRGLLREPTSALLRADAIIVTRSDQVATAELARLLDRLHHLAPDAPHLTSSHRVTAIRTLDENPLAPTLDNRRVIAFAAIGNPAAFRATLQRQGATVVREKWFRDHHRYTPYDIAMLARLLSSVDDALLITTEKDAVKLTAIAGDLAARIAVVAIAIDFPPAHGTILDSLLAKCATTRVR